MKKIIVAIVLLLALCNAVEAQELLPAFDKWSSSFDEKWDRKEIWKRARACVSMKGNTPTLLLRNFENMCRHYEKNQTAAAKRALAYEYLCYSLAYQKVRPFPKDSPPLETIVDWALGKGRVDFWGKP